MNKPPLSWTPLAHWTPLNATPREAVNYHRLMGEWMEELGWENLAQWHRLTADDITEDPPVRRVYQKRKEAV